MPRAFSVDDLALRGSAAAAGRGECPAVGERSSVAWGRGWGQGWDAPVCGFLSHHLKRIFVGDEISPIGG